MMEKLLKMIMVLTSVAWLTWIIVGGNQGDVDVTTKGTTLALGTCAVAYIILMAKRWRGDKHVGHER